MLVLKTRTKDRLFVPHVRVAPVIFQDPKMNDAVGPADTNLIPTILQVCQHSREIGLKTYTPIVRGRFSPEERAHRGLRPTTPFAYIDASRDVVYLDDIDHCLRVLLVQMKYAINGVNHVANLAASCQTLNDVLQGYFSIIPGLRDHSTLENLREFFSERLIAVHDAKQLMAGNGREQSLCLQPGPWSWERHNAESLFVGDTERVLYHGLLLKSDQS